MIFIDTEYLDQLAALTRDATPGVWVNLSHGGDGEAFVRSFVEGKPFPDDIAHDLTNADAELIAAAKTEIPELLTMIRQLYKENERLETERDDLAAVNMNLECQIDDLEDQLAEADEEVLRLEQRIEELS